MNELKAFIHHQNTQKPKLLIFTHAGALPIQYLKWSKGILEENFDIYISTPTPKDIASWDDLCNYYTEDFEKIVEENTLIMGHSMGSLIAFELLQKSQLKQNDLIVSAIAPLTSKRVSIYQELASQSFSEFEQTLKSFGGIPDYLNAQVQLMDRYIQDIQRDFKILATASVFSAPVTNSIYAMGALGDNITKTQDLNSWKDFTSTRFSLKLFSGGHFYIFDEKNQVNRYLLDLYGR